MDIRYKPKYARSADLVRRLGRAESLREEISFKASGMAWVSRARRDTLARHAHYSSRIEGNPLTLPEVEALAEGREVKADGHAKAEILNYFAALRWIWERAVKQGITEAGLLKVHGILTKGLLPVKEAGHYKTAQNAVFHGRTIIYRPPPPEAAQILTRSLVAWINSREGKAEHPVVAAGVAHHRLVSIHPVMDGNGRLGRLLEAWVLYSRGFDTLHIFALPEFYESDRPLYYSEIEKARKAGDDLTGWLDYVAGGVVETLEKTRQRIVTGGYEKTGTGLRLSGNQNAVLEMLSKGGVLTGPKICQELGISRAMLSKLMKPLIGAKLVAREGTTRGADYRLPGKK